MTSHSRSARGASGEQGALLLLWRGLHAGSADELPEMTDKLTEALKALISGMAIPGDVKRRISALQCFREVLTAFGFWIHVRPMVKSGETIRAMPVLRWMVAIAATTTSLSRWTILGNTGVGGRCTREMIRDAVGRPIKQWFGVRGSWTSGERPVARGEWCKSSGERLVRSGEQEC